MAGNRGNKSAPVAGREDPAPDLTGHAQHAQSLISARDFAQLTGFSVHTIRDWAQQGLLPAIKVGNRLRFERDGAILALRNLNKKRRRRKRHAEGQSKT